MEKLFQSISAEGLVIPITKMSQYGLDQGSQVVVEFQDDGIRIIPVQPEKKLIENKALQYLLAHLGDGASVSVTKLSDDGSWQVEVYGLGIATPLGMLIYSSAGVLLSEKSTAIADMRTAVYQTVTPA